MHQPIVEISGAQWGGRPSEARLAKALESGGVLYFPSMAFTMSPAELALLRPDMRDPKSRNISQPPKGSVKGAQGSPEELAALDAMMRRYRQQAQQLVQDMFPRYSAYLRMEPTSFRPTEVASRKQSWRADDKRMHVDAFPSRPNRGERILRVFSNVNPQDPRMWRVGEPFEDMVQKFWPQLPPYRAWQARVLRSMRITKSLRSEYDHLMLQLHDKMKRDVHYQKEGPQTVMAFPPGSTWVCFSDQTLHAVDRGQFMMEQTFFIPPQHQYDPAQSPLGILSRMAGRTLEGARQ
jgi:hypothetical protein